MAADTKNSSQDSNVSFARDLGLFDASMIGIGAMIGAGIFVLTGIAAGEAGPAALLAFILNGLVTLLTALCYAELASAYPKSGGGYSFIKKAFPGPVGFAAGWMLWFSYIIACSLYALGFGSYFWEFVRTYFPVISDAAFGLVGEHGAAVGMTILVSVAFILINMRGTAVTGKIENVMTVGKIAILAVFIAFGLKVIFDFPAESAASFTPFFPKGFNGVLLAMGLTFIAFEGYDLIATVAEEIKDPEKNIPRATLISLSVTMVVYILIMIVAIGAIRPDEGTSWEFLGKYQETAIVKAAQSFMPFFGVTLIIFGGLLSTISALNATILASSRVAFSMSRDKMLPPSLSTIHPKRLTPHIAIAVTGVIMIIACLLFPIHVVGSAASVMFLLTFTLVNFSLIAMRRKFPELQGGFRVPLYPVTPILAIILNMFLAVYQFNFDPRAWYLAIAWIVIGLLIYFMHFEKAASEDIPQVLDVSPTRPKTEYSYRIIIPMHNPDHVVRLMRLAIPIAKAHNGEIIALGVINVPQNLPIGAGLHFIGQKTPLLEKAIEYGRENGVETRSALQLAHQVPDGILNAAEAENASLILMGWKGFTSKRDRLLGEVTDKVVNHAPCDLIAVKFGADFELKSILLPTAGGPHAMLAAEFVSLYQKTYDAEVTCGYVVSEEPSEQEQVQAFEWIEKTIHRSGLEGRVERALFEGKKVTTALVKAGSEYDMVVLGASKEGLFSSVLFGEIPEKVARFSKASVMIVKRYEGKVKTLVRKAMG